jgi:hypothetical protein
VVVVALAGAPWLVRVLPVVLVVACSSHRTQQTARSEQYLHWSLYYCRQ